jgi:hypothetical protein
MALKTKEFRLGNYIQDENNLVWVIGGTQNNLIYTYGKWVELDAFKEMPITEYNLLNLGFVYDKEDDWFVYGTRKRISVRLTEGEAILYYSRDIGIDFYGIDFVDNVHRLQNICQALLQEDITLINGYSIIHQ